MNIVRKAVETFWASHYVDPTVNLCVLCGNLGVIDTRGRAISRAGVAVGRLVFCICPNGHELRASGNPPEQFFP